MHDSSKAPNDTTRPVDIEDSRPRLLDRVHHHGLRVWDTLNTRMRGSFTVAIRVEHSLMLLIGYAALGGFAAKFWG